MAVWILEGRERVCSRALGGQSSGHCSSEGLGHQVSKGCGFYSRYTWSCWKLAVRGVEGGACGSALTLRVDGGKERRAEMRTEFRDFSGMLE